MNSKSPLAVKNRLVNDLSLAYEFVLPNAENFYITPYQEGAVVSVVSSFTSISISHARPLYRFGRVMSFDVTPYQQIDPVIIFCQTGDLKPYYEIWGKVVRDGVWANRFLNRGIIKKYDASIKHFIESSSLDVQESCFAIIEMFKFKNTNILRRNEPNENFQLRGNWNG